MPESLQQIAPRFIRDIYTSRIEGRSSPEKPVPASLICQTYLKRYEIHLTPRMIRSIVEVAVPQRIPIGSVNDGYFWVLVPDEWTVVEAHYLTYVKAYAKRWKEARKMRRDMESAAFYPNNDVMRLLHSELDLVPIDERLR